MYLPNVLPALALTEVDQADARAKSLDDASVIDEIAQKLYRRHRVGRKSKVRERTWQLLPNSEKGKYRKIVKEAIQRFQATTT